MAGSLHHTAPYILQCILVSVWQHILRFAALLLLVQHKPLDVNSLHFFQMNDSVFILKIPKKIP